MEIKVVLHNIRSAHNVGSILRTAEGFGVKQVLFSGYTPRYHDQNLLPHLRDKLDKQIAKTALGSENLVELYSSGDILSDLKKLKEGGWQIIGLENNIEDKRLLELGSEMMYGKITDQVVLVLGEEVNGISDLLYGVIDYFVEIPMRGKKESFNVSVAAGIALFELTKNRQLG